MRYWSDSRRTQQMFGSRKRPQAPSQTPWLDSSTADSMRMFRVAPCRDRRVHRVRRVGSCRTFVRVARFRVIGAGPCRRTRKGPTRITYTKPHDTKHSPARTDRIRKISPPAPTRTDTSRHGTVWFVFHQIPPVPVGTGDRNLVAMLRFSINCVLKCVLDLSPARLNNNYVM